MSGSLSSPGARGEPPLTVGARLDRMPITRLHVIVLVCVGLGIFFDTYEVLLAGTLSTTLESQFHLTENSVKAVLASAFVGQFLGAIVGGRVADRFGRRRMFLVNLAVYSVFSLVGGLSPAVWLLVGSRFLVGVGLGAELALADTYLSDLMPARARGRLVSYAYTIGFLGVPAAGFLARWLVPLAPLGVAGWRWLFFIGALGALLVWALRLLLPESPRWLESAGQVAAADAAMTAWEDSARRAGKVLPEPAAAPAAPRQRAAARLLFSRGYLPRTVMAWLMSVGSAFGYYGFGTIAVLVLASKGYSILSSLTFISLSYIGYPVGSLLSLPIVERVERKLLIALTAAGMAVTGLLFGYAGTATEIVIWGFVFTLISNIFSNAYHVYLGELYPTAMRATGAGAAYSVSRIVTAALPYILIPALDDAGSGLVFGIVAAALAILIADVIALGPRTTGRTLEALTAPDGAGAPALPGQAATTTTT
jgi:MFS transporter, putative metabolite:H+ symporter